jgi:hypothetical protein
MRKPSPKPGTVAKHSRGSGRRAEAQGTAQPSPAVGSGAPRRYARNEDQLPPVSLDDAWGNLHPARIWPD